MLWKDYDTINIKKKEEIVAIRNEHANEVTGMTKKIEVLEEMVKFVVKQQNPDLEEDDINNMMTRVLTEESSGVGLYSSASTHDPHYEQVYIIENCLLDFEKYFQVTHEIALICNVGGVHLEVIVLSLSFAFFTWIMEI